MNFGSPLVQQFYDDMMEKFATEHDDISCCIDMTYKKESDADDGAQWLDAVFKLARFSLEMKHDITSAGSRGQGGS
jgi:hypothetical protein